MDDALEEHIRISAEKGLSRNEVKQLLLKSGWPEQQVNTYLEKSFKKLESGVILRAHGLSKSFEENHVLSNVDFDIRSGEIFGVIGMSGAGKTTLLNLLVGFLKPDQGDVVMALSDGTTQSVYRNPLLVRKNIGFSTQTPSFYAKLTVRENLEHFGRLYHMTDPDLTRRCNALLDLVGLKDAKDVIASHLSGGMQKRLDVACALLHDPSILVLDEPTADLDPVLRKQFWELIRQINQKGTTIIVASHFLAEIELLCTRIAILRNKSIVELGTAEELRNIYSKNYEVYLTTKSQNYTRILAALEKKKQFFVKAMQKSGELVIETPVPEKILPILSSYLEKEKDVTSLHVERPTLGKVFESVVRR